MSSAVWRAAFGTLRANLRLAFYYVLITVYTAESCGMLFRRRGVLAIFLVAFWMGFGWPLFLRPAPTHRDLLRLPLSTRDAGAVLYILRVLVPCVCMILLTPVIAPMFARTPVSPREFLAIACGVCAAFPLMSFAPFLPLPASWRLLTGGSAESCEQPALRWLAATAVWLLAPAIAVIPLVSVRAGFADWPWVSAVLGSGLAWFVWIQRERLARVTSQSAPAVGAAPGEGARWRGASGFIPLLLPLLGICCVLGLAIGLFFAVPVVPGAATAMVITLVGLSASLSAKYILGCARGLRLLPISAARLSIIMLSILVLPTLSGCLLGATLAHALHPLRLSIAHVELLCLLSLTCNVVVSVPALRSARPKSIGPLLAASAVLQVVLVLTAVHFGIAAPPDGWGFAVCLGALGASFVWLAAKLQFFSVRSIAAILIAALVCLPGFEAEPPDAAHDAADAPQLGFRNTRAGPEDLHGRCRPPAAAQLESTFIK
jgi:hypothetical protein